MRATLGLATNGGMPHPLATTSPAVDTLMRRRWRRHSEFIRQPPALRAPIGSVDPCRDLGGEVRRYGDSQGPRGRPIDLQLEDRGPLERQIGGLCAAQDAI